MPHSAVANQILICMIFVGINMSILCQQKPPEHLPLFDVISTAVRQMLQESLANAKEARDSSECMKTPSEEIYSKFAIDG